MAVRKHVLRYVGSLLLVYPICTVADASTQRQEEKRETRCRTAHDATLITQLPAECPIPSSLHAPGSSHHSITLTDCRRVPCCVCVRGRISARAANLFFHSNNNDKSPHVQINSAGKTRPYRDAFRSQSQLRLHPEVVEDVQARQSPSIGQRQIAPVPVPVPVLTQGRLRTARRQHAVLSASVARMLVYLAVEPVPDLGRSPSLATRHRNIPQSVHALQRLIARDSLSLSLSLVPTPPTAPQSTNRRRSRTHAQQLNSTHPRCLRANCANCATAQTTQRSGPNNRLGRPAVPDGSG